MEKETDDRKIEREKKELLELLLKRDDFTYQELVEDFIHVWVNHKHNIRDIFPDFDEDENEMEAAELLLKKANLTKQDVIDVCLNEWVNERLHLLTAKELQKYIDAAAAYKQARFTAKEERKRLKKEAIELVLKRSGVSKKSIVEDAMRNFFIMFCGRLGQEDWDKCACLLPVYAPKIKITAKERKRLENELMTRVIKCSKMGTSKKEISEGAIEGFFYGNIDLLTPEEQEKYKSVIYSLHYWNFDE